MESPTVQENVVPASPAVPSPRSSKSGLVAGAIALILLTVAIGAVVIYQRSTPKFALSQIRKAIQTHDKELFHEYVDVDTLVGRAVDDVMSVQLEDKTKGDDSAANALAMGMLQLMKPKLVEAARLGVDRLIEGTNDDGSASGSNREVQLFRNPGAEFGGAGGIVSTKTEGQITLVTLRFHHMKYKTDVDLVVRLRKVDGHLQVTELSNLREVMRTIADAERKQQETENELAVSRLKAAVQVNNLNLERETDDWGLTHKAYFKVIVENVGSEPVEGWDIEVSALYKGEESAAFTIPVQARQQSLAPGQKYTVKYNKDLNRFIKEDKAIWDAKLEKMEMRTKVVAVKFTSGEVVKLPHPELVASTD